MSNDVKKAGGVITSFKKKKAESLQIRGTKISFQNAQLLTSTGSSTLDFYLGGGLAIGTVCLLEEDCYQTYSILLLKYFLSEGVVNAHSLLLASADMVPADILKELPAVKSVESDSKIDKKQEAMEDSLKIAWRYKDISTTDVKDTSYTHNFDLSKHMPSEKLNQCHINAWNPVDCCDDNPMGENEIFTETSYNKLLHLIKDEIMSQELTTSAKSCSNILRIGIGCIGSPLWHHHDDKNYVDLLRFLYALKSVLRHSFAVAMVSVSSVVIQDLVLRRRLQQMCDTVVRLEPFVGSDKKTNPLFKEFDGLLHIVKLPTLNTFMYQVPTTDLAFKVKRKGFNIERLHLPPEFEDSDQQPTFGCSSVQSGHLAF